MITITRVRTHQGDLQLHRGGCRDIGKHDNNPWDPAQSYEAPTLLEAIRDQDEDMADWFGEVAWTEGAIENGCWTTRKVEWAPCFAADVKAAGITFDPETDEPHARADS